MGNGSLSLGVERPEREVIYQLPFSAEIKERVELYVYSSSVPSGQVIGWNLSLKFLVDGVLIVP